MSAPADPADLAGCRKLLDAVPEFKARLNEMASASERWGRLITEWDSLCALMDKEAPEWNKAHGTAPETYARMRELRL